MLLPFRYAAATVLYSSSSRAKGLLQFRPIPPKFNMGFRFRRGFDTFDTAVPEMKVLAMADGLPYLASERSECVVRRGVGIIMAAMMAVVSRVAFRGCKITMSQLVPQILQSRDWD